LPTFAIGSDDAATLKSLMAKGPVKAHLKLITEERTGLKDNNVWGTLPGTTAEEIIITAHHDGQFEAAFDNASGVATMLGIAEYFSKVPQAQRRRTIRFISTAGHQAGQLGANLLHDSRDTLLKNGVLVINCEHTSVTQMNQFGAAGIFKTTGVSARQWWLNTSDKLASIAFGAYKKFGVTIWDDVMYEGGGIGPLSRDMASIQLIVSPVYYSSDHDRADVVPGSGLESVARAYANIIDQANTLSRAELQPSAPPTSTATGASR
jgi:Peptidase family M28